MIYDLVDKIYKPTGVTLESDGFEYPEMEEIEGYHVNMLDPDISKVGDYVVEVNTPSRVFAGRDDLVCLKFKDRAGWLALGIEVEEDYE